MSGLRRVLLSVPAGLLLVCLLLSFWTRGAMEHLPFLKAGEAGEGLVDQRPWQTAQALAPLAVSKEEQGFAREAERLADHEVDQAFAMALREANAEATTLSGEALAIQSRVRDLENTVGQDQAEVDRLTAAAKTPKGRDVADELEVSKSELALDQSELDDEKQQLQRASGDKRSEIQRETTAREASMKKYDDQAATGGETAVISTQRYETLYGRVKAWFAQRSRRALVKQAAQGAVDDRARLTTELMALKAKGASGAGPAGEAAPSGSDAAGRTAGLGKAGGSAVRRGGTAQPVAGGTIDEKRQRVVRLQARVGQETMVNLLQDRVDTEGQLAAVYGEWEKQLRVQREIIDHLLLNSFAVILGIVLGTMLVGGGVRAGLRRARMDPRRQRTLETIADLGVELVGLLLIGLVVFGAPSQVPTILGLATAGLTVVFQDFILAFFGWFVLMGSNGIRVGDWVEINAVGGEVVEIGLFRTALLETGNWTDKGHPTGRRVTFINNFAITGQYFNFSTAGQWMWDEITLNVPQSESTYDVIEQIHGLVLKATEEDANKAEEEWRRVAKTTGLSQFSAVPSVDLRPAASGVDIKLRYVTRAGDRFSIRNRIYQDMVRVLRKVGEQPGAVG